MKELLHELAVAKAEAESRRYTFVLGQQSRRQATRQQDDDSRVVSENDEHIVQVVKMVVASALNENGEQLYPRIWNHDFIDLPEIRNQRQPTFSEDVMKIIAANSDGRERMLYVLLGATGMRIGEALGLEIDKHISPDFSTLPRQPEYHRRLLQAKRGCGISEESCGASGNRLRAPRGKARSCTQLHPSELLSTFA